MRHKNCLVIVAVFCVTGVTSLIAGSGRQTQANEPKKPVANSVPFKLAKPDKPLILLETTVNGKGPFRFVLDTGAGLTMITSELGKKLDIKSDEIQKAVGAGGSVQVRFGAVQSLSIGETRMDRLKVGIMDLTGIGKAIETDIDGIVGYNFLSKFRLTIDYPKQMVTFE